MEWECSEWIDAETAFDIGYTAAAERARCLAAVHKALADWPNIPSESTKRFAAMVIANIEGKS